MSRPAAKKTKPQPTKILALDLSTTCTGWSLFDSGKLVKYGSLTIKHRSTVEYLAKSLAAYNKLIADLAPDVVCVEDVYLRFMGAFKTLVKLQGMVEVVAHGRGTKVAYVRTVTARAAFGLPTASKQQIERYFSKLSKLLGTRDKKKLKSPTGKMIVVDFVNDTCGTKFEFEDNDICDSILVGLYYTRHKLAPYI